MAPPSERRRSERGAAVVEAAIITPLFLLLLFGIFEFGLAFKSSITISNAAQQGAREAGIQGALPESDYLILRSVQHGLGGMDLRNLDYVVVFRADGPNGTMPAECATSSQTLTASGSVACNRYTAADFYAEIDDPSTGSNTGNFRCGPGSVDRYWCPADRQDQIGNTDYVGVVVKAKHKYLTGMIGSDIDLESSTIARLEPGRT